MHQPSPVDLGALVNQDAWHVPEVGTSSGDDVPQEVLDAAQRAFEARLAGVPLLGLVFYSLLGERRSALAGLRQLRFGTPATDEVSAEVNVRQGDADDVFQ